MDKPLTITKLEAARLQLTTAIDLWFRDKDQVSIHTLSYAAYDIIHAFSKKHGRTRDLLFDALIVKDEYRTEMMRLMRKAGNFFKHADRDTDATIEFQPLTSEAFITFAILGLQSIGISANRYELAFTWWLCLTRPEMLTQRGYETLAELIPVNALDEIRSVSKSEFFDAWLEARKS